MPYVQWVPLRGAARIVANSDGEAMGVADAVLKAVFPGSTPRTVTAAGVGQDEQLGSLQIATATVAGPPPGQVVDSEVRGAVGCANRDAGLIGADIVDTVGRCYACGVREKVVVEHCYGFCYPGSPGVLELTNQFSVLGIYAHNWQSSLAKVLAHSCDVGELDVAARVLVELLRVHSEPVAEFLQKLGDGVGADLDATRGEFVCDLLGGTPSPQDATHWVAGGVMFHQSVDRLDYLGDAFFAEGRPPPARRTRPTEMSPESSSWRPRATVPGSMPRSSATWVSPPCPTFRGSRPA